MQLNDDIVHTYSIFDVFRDLETIKDDFERCDFLREIAIREILGYDTICLDCDTLRDIFDNFS